MSCPTPAHEALDAPASPPPPFVDQGQERGEKILEAMEFTSARIVMEPGSVKMPGDDNYERRWFVSGGGLGRASGPTLVEALVDWLEGLVTLSKADPDYFGRFEEMPHFGTPKSEGRDE